MNTGRRPDHCKGCVHFHNAGYGRDAPKHLHKYNAWCCYKGDTAERSVGWCKTNGVKTVVDNKEQS